MPKYYTNVHHIKTISYLYIFIISSSIWFWVSKHEDGCSQLNIHIMPNGKAGVMENDPCAVIDHWQQKGSQVSIPLNDLRIRKKLAWEWNRNENTIWGFQRRQNITMDSTTVITKFNFPKGPRSTRGKLRMVLLWWCLMNVKAIKWMFMFQFKCGYGRCSRKVSPLTSWLSSLACCAN